MFQKIGYTLEHKWDTLKSMMQSTESCNSDNHNLLKQQFLIYSDSYMRASNYQTPRGKIRLKKIAQLSF